MWTEYEMELQVDIYLPSVIFLKIKKVLITGKDAKQISIPTEKIPVKCKIKKTTQNLAKLVPN